MPRKTAKPPTPASEATVSSALRTLGGSDQNSPRSVQTFLNRIGFARLDEPANVEALSNATTRAIHGALPSNPLLAAHVLMRIAECRPPAESDLVAPTLRTTYLWLAQCAGYAVSTLPADFPDCSLLLESAAFMPLNESRFACSSLRKAILLHPACTPAVLYYAATAWPVNDARTIDENPNAPEEARVILALRR